MGGALGAGDVCGTSEEELTASVRRSPRSFGGNGTDPFFNSSSATEAARTPVSALVANATIACEDGSTADTLNITFYVGLAHGSRYRCVVWAVNGVGLRSARASEDVLVDLSAAPIAEVRCGRGGATGKDRGVQTNGWSRRSGGSLESIL